jgi:hypothetical protein
LARVAAVKSDASVAAMGDVDEAKCSNGFLEANVRVPRAAHSHLRGAPEKK